MKTKTIAFSIIAIVASAISLLLDFIRPIETALTLGVAPISLIISAVCYFADNKEKQLAGSALICGIYVTIVAAVTLAIHWGEIPISFY